MKHLERREALTLWNSYWDEMKREFFKVETLQDYSAEELLQSPSYELWMNGDKESSINLLKNRKSVEDLASNDSILRQRVHIVEHPYSSYLKWEITHYKLINIPIRKEKVFLVSSESIADVSVPGDFVIFDDNRVAVSLYDSTGVMTDMNFYDKSEDISQFLALKKLLLSRATQLEANS